MDPASPSSLSSSLLPSLAPDKAHLTRQLIALASTLPEAEQQKVLRRVQLEKSRRDFPTPAVLARYFEPRTIQTPALDVLDQALMDAESGLTPWIIFTMPPQEGKSVRVSRMFASWALLRNPHRRIANVSYADSLARRWGRAVRNDINGHPELGLSIRADTGAANEWQCDGWDGGMITAGIEAGLTGRPVDVLIVDDPLKGQKEADSPVTREMNKEFWRTTASARLSEHCIVILVMTRWHEDDLAGWLMAEHARDFKLINIPAQAEHEPDNGECKCAGDGTCVGYDILDRAPGEYMESARRRSIPGWERRKRAAGTRGWTALYQGHPGPLEGGIFKRDWWVIDKTPRAVERSDGAWFALGMTRVIQSWDMTFKDTEASDYVCGQIWAFRGAEAFLLDQVCERMEFTETLVAFRTLTAKWPQAIAKYVEDKANGPAVISSLRKEIGGIIPYTPVDSKLARASAISPFVEAGNVHVLDPLHYPWVGKFITQCANFPNDTHDDMVDGMSQALDIGLLKGGDTFLEELARERGGDGGRVDVEPMVTRSYNPQQPTDGPLATGTW